MTKTAIAWMFAMIVFVVTDLWIKHTVEFKEQPLLWLVMSVCAGIMIYGTAELIKKILK